MPPNLALHIQLLGGYQDQTLVIAHITGLQNGTGRVSPPDIRDTFHRLHLPSPANVSNYLSKLATEHLIVPQSAATWVLTPLGEERIRKLLEDASDRDLAAVGQRADPNAATFGDAPHYIIPPELAPLPFRAGVAGFLDGHPFDKNVFGISRYPRDERDPVHAAINACRDACAAAGMELHLASYRSVDDLLAKNVAASMWACKYGIAILEDRVGRGLNYNAVFEIGAMLVTGRRCLLLKDVSAPDIPTDLVGHIYVNVAIDNPEQVADAVTNWITKSLRIPT